MGVWEYGSVKNQTDKFPQKSFRLLALGFQLKNGNTSLQKSMGESRNGHLLASVGLCAGCPHLVVCRTQSAE